MGLFTVADPARGDNPNADQINDQQLLARLITPVAFEEAHRISSDLLRRFGTLPRVFAAFDDGAHIPVLPVSIANHIQSIKFLFARLLRREVASQPILSATDDLLDYLHNEMSHLECETVRVLFLNSANRLVHEKTMWEGTLASVQCHPREIVRLALHWHASAVIVVHNHPSGNPQPSASDVRMTHELCVAASYLGIAVHDHLIISRYGHFSMRAEGFLDGGAYAGESSTLNDNHVRQTVSSIIVIKAILRKLAAMIR